MKRSVQQTSRSQNPEEDFFFFFPGIIIIYGEEADKASAQPITIKETPSSDGKSQLERKCGVKRSPHECVRLLPLFLSL
ncbi:hypothetical protein CEXT_401201 [Caerostris extrusa]|uniref:Uncharacterized protein n=1 Tax=Caerostris extrusa TaxID=172846 RepID=A0AAV4PX76_CAEEX|nr:hypothetical protein CEXT_401201 [Caerostris extrusa]